VGKQRDEKLRVSEPEPAWRIVDMERLSDATLFALGFHQLAE
jgi:hypothetical protein